MKSPFILMVEDDPMDAELMLAALDDTGSCTHVEHAKSAETAWSFLERVRTDRRVSELAAVLLDLNLPGISGIELLKRIKETPEFRRVPVVILTTSLEPPDVEACYDAGANSYLVKPGTFAELSELAERIHRYWAGDNRRPPESAA
ncbi:MAG: response regulator [Spirochaetaceae bacterium]|nr:response regulator [Spirochaetaceae bacterium]